MDTPVVDFIRKYAESNVVRFHVPGHKGNDGFFSSEYDLTEIDGADVLYHDEGILKHSQSNSSEIFGTAKTLFSTEGSSLCIRAMLALVKMYAVQQKKKPVISAGRNAHKVFMTASAFLDIDVRWIYPEDNSSPVSADISADYLEKYLDKLDELPVAVYITSPDYLGNIADIKGLSEVCRNKGVLFICDNAHGAYLKFLENDLHPINLGVDMCCDSAHKTLPVLTGGAYLQISKNAPDILKNNATKAIELFASTSPSYLTLMSLDRFNGIADEYKAGVLKTAGLLLDIKRHLIQNGYVCVGNEPLKLTLYTSQYGYSGTGFSQLLRENGFECEFADPDFVVLMITPLNSEKEIFRLEKFLLSVPARWCLDNKIPTVCSLKKACSVKEALFSDSERISVNDAVGRILASPCVSCPPAVPVAVCGEILNDEAVKCFSYYNIKEIDVVK